MEPASPVSVPQWAARAPPDLREVCGTGGKAGWGGATADGQGVPDLKAMEAANKRLRPEWGQQKEKGRCTSPEGVPLGTASGQRPSPTSLCLVSPYLPLGLARWQFLYHQPP